MPQSERIKEGYYCISITLPEELDEILRDIGNRARKEGGYKLPKTLIVRALIRMLKELDVDLNLVKTEEELFQRIMKAIKKYKKS